MNPRMMELDAMRQKVLEKSNLVNDLTPTLDAVTLVEMMNEQRSMLIDYIISLEKYVKELVSNVGVNEEAEDND